jgi:transposase
MTDHAHDITGLQIATDNLTRAHTAYYHRIITAHTNGMSLRNIANIVGVSHQTVHNIITAHNRTGN